MTPESRWRTALAASHNILRSSQIYQENNFDEDHSDLRYKHSYSFQAIDIQWQIQDFHEVVAPTPKLVLFCKFCCRKLHESERIWAPGARVPGAPPSPLDPPVSFTVNLHLLSSAAHTPTANHEQAKYMVKRNLAAKFKFSSL